MSQKSLTTHLGHLREAGIYRLSSADHPALEKSATALGFACFNVRLENAADMGAILAALGRDLGFPGWYGANLDALSDCLTDFSWRGAKGYVVIIAGADSPHADPGSFAALDEVFSTAIDDWREQGIPFWVFYESGSARHTAGLAAFPPLT
ncbi:MAG: barstar family protein [Betaproteobacteria bacterium]|nr:barstar family protein [Betaproteobacteria bacterium]